MSTKDDLQSAFAGESQANRKYLAFAKKADQDGFTQIAKLFRAAAAAETVHAHAHLRALDGVKGTIENLEEAVAGESYEVDEMYPPFIEGAVTEGNKRAEITFKNAFEVEKVHRDFYKEALASVKNEKDLPWTKIYVCEICGNTVYGDAQDNCSVCRAPRDKFFEVE